MGDRAPEYEGRLVVGRCPTTGESSLFALDALMGGQCVQHGPVGKRVPGCGARLALCRTCGARSRRIDEGGMLGRCHHCGRTGDGPHAAAAAERSRFHTATIVAAAYRRSETR